ncbi:alpha/beta fold hydrolase [Streptomyces sp. NPDC048415]|uniref:esterase/lipase family protein n=1 Tax=Streptomyces sp. NPDC048415 TaxID=3154822 RepID=UPI00343A49D1
MHAKRGRQARAAVLFVHGLGGDGYETWGKWPELVFEQTSIEPLDVVTYRYESFSKSWRRRQLGANLPFIASQLADWIRSLEEDHDYQDIYLVAHSLGGLVAESAAQKYLTSLGTGAPGATAIGAIYLLASPRLGAGLALGPFRQLIPEVEWLRKNSQQAMDAESYMQSHVESLGTAASAGYYDFLIPRYSAIAGGDRLVSKMSGLFGVPEKQRLRLSGNHRSIVKPDDENQEQHRRLLKIVRTSGDIRRAWRRQNLHELRFARQGPGSGDSLRSSFLVTELRSDNPTGAYEQAYNKSCWSSDLPDVQVIDRRNAIVVADMPTDLLISVHDATRIIEGSPQCKLVVEGAFHDYQTQKNLTLLVVPVGADSEEAVRIVQSWLPAPPHRSVSVEGAATLDDFTGLVAQWIDVVFGRDPVRWPRVRLGHSYGTEGRDFV